MVCLYRWTLNHVQVGLIGLVKGLHQEGRLFQAFHTHCILLSTEMKSNDATHSIDGHKPNTLKSMMQPTSLMGQANHKAVNLLLLNV